MLYNIEQKEIRNVETCKKCKHYNKTTHQCFGIGVACFEYDSKTQTIIDNITKMPIKITKEE